MRVRGLAVLCLCLAALSACVRTHNAELQLAPPSHRQAYNGPAIKGMAVSVTDRRAKKDVIGTNWAVTDTKSTWIVTPTRPVADTIRDGIVAEFQARGVPANGGPARLQVDVRDVDSRAVWHMFRTQVYGSAMLTVTVEGPSGQTYLKKDFVDGEERWNEVFMGNQDESKVQLQAVLAKMIAAMADDQSVGIALSKAAAEAP